MEEGSNRGARVASISPSGTSGAALQGDKVGIVKGVERTLGPGTPQRPEQLEVLVEKETSIRGRFGGY